MRCWRRCRAARRQFDDAARAIGFAIVFDAFDGFVARATRTNTDFGKQFDSLADMVSFGMAPAVLAFAWGVQVMMQADGAEARHVHQLAWLVCLAFAICCAWRLARFNVHGMAPGGLRYFVGMPTPAAAGMIAATVHAAGEPLVDWRWSLAWLALILAVASLMVSSIRYPSFKELPWGKRQHSLTIIAATLLVGSIIKYSEVVLILIASAYLLSGLGRARGATGAAPAGFAHRLKCPSPKIPCAWPLPARLAPRSGPQDVDGGERLPGRRGAPVR